MYTVVNNIKRSFAVFSAVFFTVITTKVKGHEHCTLQQLTDCAKPLSVLIDSGLTFISSQADLDKICPELRGAISCIHSHTRRCMTNNQSEHFQKLFRGTGKMVTELCVNGTFQQEYLKHAPCMKQAESENEVCLKRYARAMKEVTDNTPEMDNSDPDIFNALKKKREAADLGIRNVCCIFQEYVECLTHTMRRKCGEEAAKFSNKFMEKISAAMMKSHCRQYGRRHCGLTSSGTIEESTLALVLLSLLAVLWR